MRHNFSGERSTRFVAAEPSSCPKLTRGVLQYDFGDEAGYTPLIPMYTLGHDFSPANIHAGGLRYHGAGAVVSQLRSDGMIDAVDIPQLETFAGTAPVILFNLSGHGLIDMAAYDQYIAGDLANYEVTDEDVARTTDSLAKLI